MVHQVAEHGENVGDLNISADVQTELASEAFDNDENAKSMLARVLFSLSSTSSRALSGDSWFLGPQVEKGKKNGKCREYMPYAMPGNRRDRIAKIVTFLVGNPENPMGNQKRHHCCHEVTPLGRQTAADRA